MTDRPGVAAFDFDGTLARQDTMVPFLVAASGWPRLTLAGLRCLPTGVRQGRDGMKLATVARLFRGWTEERFVEHGRTYAATLVDLLRPEMLERLRWHQDQGHPVVLVSASLATYLRPLARELGIDDVLAVELACDVQGRLTGEVVGGANCRGHQKVVRLKAWLAERYGEGVDVELWAYGDSSGDEELLAFADHATWVGKRATRNPRPTV
ncbi:MAG TPA: HAD-IB family hydrolase [Acidimicrobiales bacterium]